MAISVKLIRMQLSLLKHTQKACDFAANRVAQDKIGLLMARTHGSKVSYSTQVFKDFIGRWIVPKANTQPGVLLYLHGGGYVAGNIDYAKGFGTILAAKNGIRVFCAAYRLAPENRFPSAVLDALEAYEYLLAYGYKAKDIILCGESAGGGLIYALVHKLKALSLPLPGGLIAISPWTDLTLSGESIETIGDRDASLSKDCLAYYAHLYTDDPENPLASPLFGDLTGFPPSLIYAGGCEILLDDSVRMHKKLRESGCKSSLYVARNMWHAYVLYGVKPSPQNHLQIGSFIKDVTR
ncbi:MAG: alpha/beta hydrolase [Clostridiales bacterium]|nr:alpha/beta hydrolase [Clostridiales bacterium]